ncbi:MAG: 4-hydroxy-3-methylbut-2-enyl diphosphate reductase [Thermoleophilia bacterium]|nr:4-hydroxy-3-methylbut-2-enyl diphosphate reductase [Thermoleophilia bacterium]
MTPVEIRISEYAGYCWGVERALKLARQAAAEARGPIHTLGPLIHNPTVISALAQQGIEVLEDSRAKTAGTMIIRSHGVPRQVMDELAARAVAVVDATCTFVKAAQDKAARLREEGYQVVILGEPAHPEVLGIRSYAGPDSLVVEGPEDLPPELEKQRVGVVVQTTQSHERLAALSAALAPRVREMRVYNTICSATEQRQTAAVAMARAVDVVLVVGGKNSGNTTRLAELCAAVQPRTYHIESADEIRSEWLRNVMAVGVTAGASTPPEQIEAAVTRLREMVR